MHRTDEPDDATTGTVEWYDADRGVGSIRPDDGAPECKVQLGAEHSIDVSTLSAGDRVTFRIREEAGERTATNLARLQAFQRWENEGGAIGPDKPSP